MRKFNEWLSKDDSGQSDDLATNQLEQMVDRVIGLIYNADKQTQNALIEKFISNIRKRLNG